MPKRIFWLATGAALGAGSSLWAERRVRRTVQEATARLQPDALVVGVGRSARQVAESAGGRVRDAVTSGRDEMQRREEELWAELAAQGVAVAPSPRSPATAPAPAPARTRDLPDVSAGPLRRVPPVRRKRRQAKSPSHLAK